MALDQAAAYVETCQTQLYAYAALLKKRGLELLEEGQPYQYEQTISTTWGLAFERIRTNCPGAADLRSLCAFLAPEAIYVRELAGAAEHLPEVLAKSLTDEVALKEVRAELLRYSLISTEGDAISIHRLVQEVTRGRMAGDARDEWLIAALRSETGC